MLEIELFCMKKDLALNNLQRLICHKSQTSKQLFLLSLRFGQISPLAFFMWFLPWLRIGMMSLVTVSPVITAFHSCCLSHHVFDQVKLWPAWVGFETTIFWQCSPGTVETQRLYLQRHGPRRTIKDGFFFL